MISQFTAEFEKFASQESEIIQALSPEAMVALFGVYCQTMSRQQPKVTPKSKTKPEPKQQRPRVRNRSREASVKQLRCIANMIDKNQLDEDIDTENLTMGEASDLIDQGIRNGRRPTPEPVSDPEPQEEEEPQGSFQGAYNNQTGNMASQNTLWG